jgi:hypothetical protein
MLNFIGRSFGGRRAALELFGCTAVSSGGIFRLPAADFADVAAAIAELTAAEGTALAIDGTQPIWQNYVNIGASAYWRNKIR